MLPVNWGQKVNSKTGLNVSNSIDTGILLHPKEAVGLKI